MEIPKILSDKDLEMARQYGGADLVNYDLPDELRSCDKGEHLQRSLVLQPNHQDCKKLQDLVNNHKPDY